MFEAIVPPEIWTKVIDKWTNIVNLGGFDNARDWYSCPICEYMKHIFGGDEYNHGNCVFCPLYNSNPCWCDRGKKNQAEYAQPISIH